MASITYQLMTEYDALSRAAVKVKDYERANVFSSAENMVNNFLHGRTTEECLSLTKNAFVSIVNRDNPKLELSAEAEEAYREAIIMVDIFAEQYKLTLTN